MGSTAAQRRQVDAQVIPHDHELRQARQATAAAGREHVDVGALLRQELAGQCRRRSTSTPSSGSASTSTETPRWKASGRSQPTISLWLSSGTSAEWPGSLAFSFSCCRSRVAAVPVRARRSVHLDEPAVQRACELLAGFFALWHVERRCPSSARAGLRPPRFATTAWDRPPSRARRAVQVIGTHEENSAARGGMPAGRRVPRHARRGRTSSPALPPVVSAARGTPRRLDSPVESQRLLGGARSREQWSANASRVTNAGQR